jgi:hypothetical protein
MRINLGYLKIKNPSNNVQDLEFKRQRCRSVKTNTKRGQLNVIVANLNIQRTFWYIGGGEKRLVR